jgi:hypothetical protein
MHSEDNYGSIEESALRRDASGLWKNLGSIFQENHGALLRIEMLFNWCFSNGGREILWVPRANEESFNPRCARIPQILITEIQERSPEVLMLAVAISIPQGAVPAMILGSDILHSELTAVNNLYEGRPATTQHTDVAFAAMIDTVRHLHNSRLQPTERLDALHSAKVLLSAEHSAPACPRLLVMLQHAVLQQERRCTG